jgi:hypothetical protein
MTTDTPHLTSREAPLPATSSGFRRVAVILGAWFGASTTLGFSGVLVSLPRFAVPMLIWGTFIGCVFVYRRDAHVRAALGRVPLAIPIAWHAIVRTGYGLGIVMEGERGGLPRSFADIAGPGDIAVGLLALVALAFSGVRTKRARFVVLVWNWLALADIIAAFVAAQRVIVFGEGPVAFSAISYFPFAWLPTLVVPLVFATHIWIFARLRRIE